MSKHIVAGTGCNMGCTYCVSPDTGVLMASFKQKPITDVSEGERVLAFDRTPEDTRKKSYQTATVESIHTHTATAVDIETSEGTVTAEKSHPFYANTGRKTGFREVNDLDAGDKIYYAFDAVDYPENNDYQIGYIHGAFAGDGTIPGWKNRADYDPQNGFNNRAAFISSIDEKINETIIEYASNVLPDICFELCERGYGDHDKTAEMASTSDYERLRESVTSPIDTDDYRRGWLAGFFDTDGSYPKGKQLTFTNTNEGFLNRTTQYLDALGYDWSRDEGVDGDYATAIRLTPGRNTDGIFKFLNEIRPKVDRKRESFTGNQRISGKATIQSIGNERVLELYDLTTSESTFIADGFLSRNCYEEPSREISGQEMELDYDLDAILDRLQSFYQRDPHQAPGLHGGEPLLMADEDIETVLAFIDDTWPDDTRPSIQTNGTLIADRHIELFEEYDVSVGISCDGPPELNTERKARLGGEEVTDDFAERTNRAITRLADAGVNVGLITVLSKANAGDDEKLERLLSWMDNLNQMGVTGHFNPAIPYEDVQQDVSLSPERLADVYERCVDWYFAEEYRQWGPFDSMYDNLHGNGLSGCVNRRCDVSGAEAAQIVKGDGETTGCMKTLEAYADGEQFLQGPSTNNEYGEREERYDVLEQLPGPYTDDVQDGDTSDHGGCKGCKYWSVCNGGCPSSGVDEDWRNRTIWCEAKYTAYEKIEEHIRSGAPNVQLTTDLPWDADITEQASHGQLDLQPYAALRPDVRGRSSAIGHADIPEHRDALLSAANVDPREYESDVEPYRVAIDRLTNTSDFEAQVRAHEYRVGEDNVAVDWDAQTVYTDTSDGETVIPEDADGAERDTRRPDDDTADASDDEGCGCRPDCGCRENDADGPEDDTETTDGSVSRDDWRELDDDTVGVEVS